MLVMRSMWNKILFLFFYLRLSNSATLITVPNQNYYKPQSKLEAITLATCTIVIDRLCPDKDVTFYLYSQSHPEIPEPIYIGSQPGDSNLNTTAFRPDLPTKIIIHGYNSDMYLNVLVEIKKQYLLSKQELNIFAVDWAPLAIGPCYPAAVWNTRHVGKCTAQLINRIRETGAEDIHFIGFSLGGQLANFVANNLQPYKLPRITGLDPAGPGFLLASNDNKLDKTDALFVDVIHTNAFIQGTYEESGHVDFFINGGVIQPGCWAQDRFFACNHHRAPMYFAESINSQMGFYGWPCPTYHDYLKGNCLPKEPQIIMGEHIDTTNNGVHLVITDSVEPFAVGKYTGPSIEIYVKSESARLEILNKFRTEISNYIDEDDLVDALSELTRQNHQRVLERHRALSLV